MSTDHTIDSTDYAILTAIKHSSRSLWKNKIHEHITEKTDLPLTKSVSVQTVGRRVDNLQEQGYLENVIASPDELKRDLIIAFKLTNEGEAVRSEKRREILKETVQENLFAEEKSTDIGKEALTALVREECGDALYDVPIEEHSEHELISLMAVFYTKQEAVNTFEDKHQDVLTESTPMSKAAKIQP